MAVFYSNSIYKSSTLVFGSTFLAANTQGILSYTPLCSNPMADLNIMLMCCEDSVLGTLISLVPLMGFSTYTETINKDMPFVLMPFFMVMEMGSQSLRVISLSLRMAANATAGHTLVSLMLSYTYSFMAYSIKLKFQLAGILLVVLCLGFFSLEFIVSSMQSYVMLILAAYYELDSE